MARHDAEALIRGSKSKRVSFEILAQEFWRGQQLDNVSAPSQVVMEFLRELESAGVIELPPRHGRAWGCYAANTPNFVTRVEEKKERVRDTTLWVPELVFARDIKDTRRKSLLRVLNQWLLDNGRPTDMVPLKERALEIWGNEKAVSADANSRIALFGGSLPLAAIGAFVPVYPLTFEVCPDSSTSVAIISENFDSWWTLQAWNSEAKRFRAVVYGQGRAGQASAPYLEEIVTRTGVSRFEYIGDIDREGISIPVMINDIRKKASLAPIAPCLALYRHMLSHGLRQPAGEAAGASQDSLVWLEDLAGETEEVLRSGHRIAQETITKRVLGGVW